MKILSVGRYKAEYLVLYGIETLNEAWRVYFTEILKVTECKSDMNYQMVEGINDVEIVKLDDIPPTFVWYINGDDSEKLEIELAKKLNIERTLSVYSIVVEVEPKDSTHFVFDFKKLIQILRREIYPISCNEDQIISEFMKNCDDRGQIKPLVLYHDNLIKLSIEMGCVGTADTWTVEGTKICGSLARVYGEENKYYRPSFVFTIESNKPGPYGHCLPFDKEMKKKADNLANMIFHLMKM